ncbi:hypothetical protein HKX48_001028 [Thoreauomyces humboldtii]|nr:hypothetical protein HKX48_001028 [Thoreauomyces humboldtii]
MLTAALLPSLRRLPFGRVSPLIRAYHHSQEINLPIADPPQPTITSASSFANDMNPFPHTSKGVAIGRTIPEQAADMIRERSSGGKRSSSSERDANLWTEDRDGLKTGTKEVQK